MGISFNPSETADPIMDGAIQIAVCLNERSAASIESIRCKNNGNTAFITVTDEDSAKLEYLLIPVDKSRKERNELVFEARVEREVAARMKEVHAVHANGVTGDGMLMEDNCAPRTWLPTASTLMRQSKTIRSFMTGFSA